MQRVIDILADWSVEERTGIRWSDDFNDLLYGDAGTILFLAYEAARDGDRQARELAVKGSLLLASRAQPASGGHYWLFRRSKPFNLPGLSHGTAGITYVLATVGAMTDDETLLDAATAGFTYLQSIATVEDELVRMPYGWPLENWAGLFEFGWAHGLVGYAALMTRLQQLEVETAAAARYNALFVNTLAHIGLPADPLPPFSEPSTPLDMRFGRAGVLALISDHGTRLQLRDALWEQIEQRAIRKSGTAYWEVDAPEFMGGGTATFTGILHGAAGIGLALLHLHAALLDERPHVSLPDDPKAWTDPNKSRVFPGN